MVEFPVFQTLVEEEQQQLVLIGILYSPVQICIPPQEVSKIKENFLQALHHNFTSLIYY